MIVMMLVGVIVTFLLFLGFLFFVNMKGKTSLQPLTQTDERKTFNSLRFGENTVEAKVTFTDRPTDGGNTACGIIFYLLMFAQLVVGIVIVVIGNAQLIPEGDCPDGLEKLLDMGPGLPNYCVPPATLEEVEACVERNPVVNWWDIEYNYSDYGSGNYYFGNYYYTYSGNGRRLEADEGNVLGRRLQVGEPQKLGRILLERRSDGEVAASIKHDLFSALHMTQFRPVRKFFHTVGRRLQQSDACMMNCDSPNTKVDLWGGFEEFAQIPIVIFCCIAAAVPLWLVTLRAFTPAVVWGTLFLNLLGLVYVSIRPTVNTFWIVVTVLYIGLVFFMRKKILTAIEIIKVAMKGLTETPSVFAACFVCFLMYASYIAFWEISIISSTGVQKLVEDPFDGFMPCRLETPPYVQSLTQFLIICFIPTTFFFMNASLCCCATGIGAWYFHSDDPQRPQSPAFVGLKWAFFDSTGPVFVASLIQYVVHEIRKLCTRSFFCPCDPIFLTLRILWCFIEKAVQAFTKFMLLGHIFHGGGVVQTAKNSYQVLKNNLGQALVTDMISAQVVNWSLIVFSVGFGAASCAWMDGQMGEGLFVGGLMGFGPEMAFVAVCLLFLFFASYPLFSLVIVIGFVAGPVCRAEFIGGNLFVGFFTGVFFSAITSIIFRFVGKIVHNSTDVIMYCIALEKETGKQQERFENMYTVLKDQIGQGTTDTTGIAQGREVAAAADNQEWPRETVAAGNNAAAPGSCAKCGAQMSGESKFCTSCGAPRT